MENAIIIDEGFRSLLPALSRATFELLEENILENGCRDPLVLWGDILIDGHNRYMICEKHDIPFTTINKDFTSRDEALIWIISVQVSRRNLTPLQLSHYRGLHYRADKALAGTDGAISLEGSGYKSGSNSASSAKSTATRLSQLYSVSRVTIERDAKVAEAIEAIRGFSNVAKMKVLSGEINADKKVLAALAGMPAEVVEEVARQIEEGFFDNRKLEFYAPQDEGSDVGAGGAPADGSTAGNGSAGQAGPQGQQSPGASLSDITGDFSAELKKLANAGDSNALKIALRSYIDILEEMYSWI